MKNTKMKSYTLDEVKDELIGKKGTDKREQYELDLHLDLLGDLIKKVRKDRHLTQDQLGHLVGIKKSQISKLENNTTDVRLETVLKVFLAMKAKVNIKVELEAEELNLA